MAQQSTNLQNTDKKKEKIEKDLKKKKIKKRVLFGPDHDKYEEAEIKLGVKGIVKITRTNVETGEIKEEKLYTNLITNVGLQMIGNALIDNAAFTGGITYLALGDDNTAVVAGDTTLINETFRKEITTRTRIGQDIEFATFLTTAEANDTHYEMGLFGCDADGDPDTGVLFDRLVLDAEVKAATETWTIEITIQIRNKV